jgi:hypothetical protein
MRLWDRTAGNVIVMRAPRGSLEPRLPQGDGGFPEGSLDGHRAEMGVGRQIRSWAKTEQISDWKPSGIFRIIAVNRRHGQHTRRQTSSKEMV